MREVRVIARIMFDASTQRSTCSSVWRQGKPLASGGRQWRWPLRPRSRTDSAHTPDLGKPPPADLLHPLESPRSPSTRGVLHEAQTRALLCSAPLITCIMLVCTKVRVTRSL